jgi:hypothetical protein
VAAALLLGGCADVAQPPSVVLVLIDQLRKDHSDRFLEEVNALARDGVVFEQMRSAAPWTYPSVVRRDKHSVHDFNLRVPFLILPSKRLAAPRRVPGPASQVDFVPTLLEWLDLALEAPRPGRSLLAAIRDGSPLDPRRPIYARAWSFGAFNDAVVLKGRKYVRFIAGAEGGVVARRTFDPRETVSLGDRFGLASLRLREAASDHGLRFEASWDGVPPEIEAPLRALGYLE